MKKYDTEAQMRYGNTEAYREHTEKTKSYTKEKWADVNEGLMAIFGEFATCMKSGADVSSATAQSLVRKLQAYITDNYYTCTREILAGLGKMYVCDGRFTENIDKHGEGTAKYAAMAIEEFCVNG